MPRIDSAQRTPAQALAVALAATVLMSLPEAVSADVLLAPGSEWRYTFTDPTGDPSWNDLGFDDSGWLLGNAPFSSCVSCPDSDFDRATEWPADAADGDDLWVRRVLDLSDVELASVAWDLGVDNGYKLYANGTLVASDNAEGFTTRWEYSGNFGGVTLNAGANVIAVALEDHGGLTAFDMQVTGDRRTPSVPEPATLLLTALGLLGVSLGIHKRRP